MRRRRVMRVEKPRNTGLPVDRRRTLSNRLRMVFSQTWANMVRLRSRKSIRGWSTVSDSCWMMLRWAVRDTCPVPDTFASKLPTSRTLSFIWMSRLCTSRDQYSLNMVGNSQKCTAVCQFVTLSPQTISDVFSDNEWCRSSTTLHYAL